VVSRDFNGYTEKPISQVLYEVKKEAKEFIATRFQMARTELTEKASTVKAVAPAAIMGVVLGAMAFLLLSVALVTVLAWLFGGAPSAWATAFCIVGVLYGLVGIGCLAYAMRLLRKQSLMPERILRVLKQDQIWIQTETRTQP
jgi:uncharacterized membrane protein YqjE